MTRQNHNRCVVGPSGGKQGPGSYEGCSPAGVLMWWLRGRRLPQTKRFSATPLGLVLAAMAVASGCARDNGLPADLIGHLDGQGIVVSAATADAPLSSRSGLVLFDGNPDLEARIVATFGLSRVSEDQRQFRWVAQQVKFTPQALWGISGRPAILKLRNGAQFEFLYLLKRDDGRVYLFAEYAYG